MADTTTSNTYALCSGMLQFAAVSYIAFFVTKKYQPALITRDASAAVAVIKQALPAAITTAFFTEEPTPISTPTDVVSPVLTVSRSHASIWGDSMWPLAVFLGFLIFLIALVAIVSGVSAWIESVESVSDTGSGKSK